MKKPHHSYPLLQFAREVSEVGSSSTPRLDDDKEGLDRSALVVSSINIWALMG